MTKLSPPGSRTRLSAPSQVVAGILLKSGLDRRTVLEELRRNGNRVSADLVRTWYDGRATPRGWKASILAEAVAKLGCPGEAESIRELTGTRRLHREEIVRGLGRVFVRPRGRSRPAGQDPEPG